MGTDPATQPWTRHPDLVDQPEWSPGRRLASWVWALAPIFTLGLANGALFLYAAIRRRTLAWWAAAGAYCAITVAIFTLTGSDEGTTEYTVFGALIMTNLIVGAGHALGTRRRVFQPDVIVDLDNDPVLAAAVNAKERRDLARQILAQDPQLARDLAIGRPDLDRGYDDGGLVDVNTAPATVLAGLPGVTQPDVERLVAARTAAGGFSSLDEMAILADLAPALVDSLRDRLVLSPR
jgi:DNA uptake protein ComE-like DNA-binding protein